MQIEQILATLHDFEIAIEALTNARNAKAGPEIVAQRRARVEIVRGRIVKEMQKEKDNDNQA
jgi:hypothetical protein